MTKELQDFFKIISEGKKSSKKETENESLLSNEKVSVSVKASELKDFFSAINEEKKKTQRDAGPARLRRSWNPARQTKHAKCMQNTLVSSSACKTASTSSPTLGRLGPYRPLPAASLDLALATSCAMRLSSSSESAASP